MDELVDRVRQALAAEYPGAPNGRVRDVPDRRAIRWYTTTGLVDRPAGMRGRTALYGPRHLLQLVAVKRRQAQGHSLAAIQAELAGASDADLAIAARVPEGLLTVTDDAAPADGPVRSRFWATATATATAPPAATATALDVPAGSPRGVADPATPRPESATARPVGGVALGGGAILVLPVRPDAADCAAIATAARPLLDLLAARGLLAGDTLVDGS
ncbi:MerR family transcriptional regulator [Actinoplanes sp. ATCC 53533]|uniref:MerR family transcriptional regulator n=1 Tax=Actinoplanes sp. ATCC 53533 TaxID=1288362 RepID=UPI001F274D46|nr:MerR family transcriptional regulator [Actinoplanes sp. ATCC 53533]